MAIMATATVKNSKALRLTTLITLLSWLTFSASPIVMAGKWQFTPNVGIEETYTDNVDLVIIDPTASFVSQAIVGLDADYQSRLLNFTFSGQNNSLFFSHDSDINDSYLSLETTMQYALGTSGLQLIAMANVDNTNRNAAKNGLANLVSGDTVQSETYASGLQYNVNNSAFSIASSVIYNINRFEDDIGEYDGISATLNSASGNNARTVFWQLASSYSKREQDFLGDTRTGKQYQVDAKLGLITSFNLNPFIRFYDEDFSGNIGNQQQDTTASWGPGFRWLVTPHLIFDLSYNVVGDDTVSDDYVATSIQWEPSERTSLTAGYNQRFFGDSYNLDLQHKTKRLTNTVTYDESLEVFDRNNFERVELGLFLCPIGATREDISQCFIQSEQADNSEFQLINFTYLQPLESNEFSLNKRLSWTSKLQLARTSFTINSFATSREGLESQVTDETLGASLTIERKISGKSSLTLSAKYDYRIFDKENPEGSRQEDYYRTVSATYNKKLASSLATHFTLQQVNRSSDNDQYSYDEARVIINITKEF